MRERGHTPEELAAENDRLRTELAILRAMEQRFRTTLYAIGDGVLATDVHGRVMQMNRVAEQLTGWSEAESFGHPTDEIFPIVNEESRNAVEDPVQRVLREGRVVGLANHTLLLARDGTETPIADSGAPIFDAAGNLAGVVLVFRDQTAEREAEKALLREQESLRQTQKILEQTVAKLERSNRDLEQFAYVASHDLQEPLRMVASYVQLLAQRFEGKGDEKTETYFGYAVEGAVRMKALIQDLLAFSRVAREPEPPAQVDCNDIVRGVLQGLAKNLEENQAEVLVHDLPVVSGNGNLLAQVFQNLVANAVKFRREERPRVEISASRQGSFWRFSVADNGIGIEPKFHDRIFVIFQRLHGRDRYSGTGIGLAIVKKIIEHSGGRIGVESEPGKGSTFTFTIPAEEPLEADT